jgi:hypothetical protein
MDTLPKHLRITIVGGDRLSSRRRRSKEDTGRWRSDILRRGMEKTHRDGRPGMKEWTALVKSETIEEYIERVGYREYEFEIIRRRGWYQKL